MTEIKGILNLKPEGVNQQSVNEIVGKVDFCVINSRRCPLVPSPMPIISEPPCHISCDRLPSLSRLLNMMNKILKELMSILNRLLPINDPVNSINNYPPIDRDLYFLCRSASPLTSQSTSHSLGDVVKTILKRVFEGRKKKVKKRLFSKLKNITKKSVKKFTRKIIDLTFNLTKKLNLDAVHKRLESILSEPIDRLLKH